MLENYSFFESSSQNVYHTHTLTHSLSLPPLDTILLKPMSVVSHFQDITPFLPDYREKEKTLTAFRSLGGIEI